MGQPKTARSAAEQWVADLPAPSVDAREPWPVLSFPPEARALIAHGQAQWTALGALPKGKDAAQQRPPRTLPAVLAPVPVPPAVPPTKPQRGMVHARPIPVARAIAGPPAWPPRVLRQATPATYLAPPRGRGPIRGQIPQVERRSLGLWAFLALVMGIASLAPFVVWQDAPSQWIPVTGTIAFFCSVLVFSGTQPGITRHGTISTARWGCGFALIATALWIVGILLVTGQFSLG